MRNRSKYPLDGVPLVVGIACLLKQFHPAYTRKLISYLGQFIRSNLQQVFNDVDVKAQDVPVGILNTLIFLDQLCQYSSIPRSVVHAFVPPYIFDALRFPNASSKK